MVWGLEDSSQQSCNQADGASEAVNRELSFHEVYHLSITDEQLQDLVCLFIWSAAVSDGADMEGCDDDLELPPFQLQQLKRKCAEAQRQGPPALSDDTELASLVGDIGIVKEQLQILIRYCSWTSTLAARCSILSPSQISQLRTRCEVQGLTCSWMTLHEGMSKDCNVSDERLQNLMRFYNWRYSSFGCADLDDERGLPDKHFDELIRYLSWCESRVIAMAGTSPSLQVKIELAAPEGVPPIGSFPVEVCTPVCEQHVPERLWTFESSSEDEMFDMSSSSKDINRNGQPMDPLNVGGNGDEKVPVQAAHKGAALGTQLESLSCASDASEEIICIPPCDVGRPIRQLVGNSMAQAGSTQETPPQPSRSSPFENDLALRAAVESLPSSFENAHKTMEPAEDTDISLDYQGSTPAANLVRDRMSSLDASCLTPEPVVFRKRSPSPPAETMMFSICTEKSHSELGKVCNKCKSTCGTESLDSGIAAAHVRSEQDFNSADQMASLADRGRTGCSAPKMLARSHAHVRSRSSLSLPTSDFPILCQTPCLKLPNGAAHPLPKDDVALAVGGQCVPSPAAGSDAPQQLQTPTMSQSSSNNDFTVPLRKSTRTPRGSCAVECAFPPRECLSPTLRAKAKPLSSASRYAVTQGQAPASWQDLNGQWSSWSSWWPSILDRLNCSCYDEAVQPLQETSEDLHADH